VVTPADRTAVRLTAALGAWTVFEWATRIRNAAAEADVDALVKAANVGVATGFTAMGVGLLAYAWRNRRTGLPAGAPRVLGIVAFVITAWWSVRTLLVWIHEHDTPFKVVHTVLAVISITLALLARRAAVRAATPELARA
jgi:hypothetical protein